MSLEELEPGAMPDGDPRLNRMLALLESMDDRMSRLEGQVAELTQTGPAVVAGVTDTIDSAVARAAERGIDVDARLRSSVELVEALTEPRTVEVMGRLVDRIELVDQSLMMLEQVPDLAAGAVDTVDRLVAAAAASGIDIDARLRASLTLAERLTNPDTVEALLALTHHADQAAEAAAMMSQAPGMVAGAIDTVDGVMGGLQARGIDVDARVKALLVATEKLTDPTTLDALGRLASHAGEAAEAAEMLSQAPGMVAGAIDTVDGVIGGLHARGIDVDARVKALLVATEKLTDPAVLGTLTRLADQAPLLEESLQIAEQLPGMAAGAMDTVDGLVRQLQSRGVDLDARMRGILAVTEAATDPRALAAVERLLKNPEALEQFAELAEQAPGMVAGAIDTFDGMVGRLAERGIDFDQRVVALTQALEALTDPVIIHLLNTVLARGCDLSRLVETLLESGVFDEEAVQVVGSTSHAVVQTQADKPAPVGAFGALGAIFDPDVQRSLGFAIAFARTFGKRLNG